MEKSHKALELRICYFISSYRSPEQLCRLVKTLQLGDPGSSIVIHHDLFQFPLDPSLFKGEPDVHVLTSDHPMIWGDMSLEAVRWRVFRWILKNLNVDWVMLLSEQDYPITPLQTLRSRLTGSDVDAIIDGERIDETLDKRRLHESTIRYMYQYKSLPFLKIEQRLPKWWRVIMRKSRSYFYTAVDRSQEKVFIYQFAAELMLPSRIGFRPAKNPFSVDYPCWRHRPWYALSRSAMEHVIKYLDSHPDFVSYYSRTVIPLESATGTIVFNDPELKVENIGLHAIVWSNPDSGRPDVIGLDDLEFLRNSGAVFARKFDHSSAEVLSEIDKMVFPPSRSSNSEGPKTPS